MQRLVHINQRVQRSDIAFSVANACARAPPLMPPRCDEKTLCEPGFNNTSKGKDQNQRYLFAQVTTLPAPARAFVYKRRKGAPVLTLDHQSQNR